MPDLELKDADKLMVMRSKLNTASRAILFWQDPIDKSPTAIYKNPSEGMLRKCIKELVMQLHRSEVAHGRRKVDDSILPRR
jgi:hypothetical protein